MLARAKKLAKTSQHWWAHHAAIVMRGGAVLSAEPNGASAHAEQRALGRLWPSKRRGTKVLSIRINGQGELAMAKPCPDCEAYLAANGVKTVLYSTDEGTLTLMRIAS